MDVARGVKIPIYTDNEVYNRLNNVFSLPGSR